MTLKSSDDRSLKKKLSEDGPSVPGVKSVDREPWREKTERKLLRVVVGCTHTIDPALSNRLILGPHIITGP